MGKTEKRLLAWSIISNVVRPSEFRLQNFDLGGTHGVDAGTRQQVSPDELSDLLLELRSRLRLEQNFPHAVLKGGLDLTKVFIGDLADIDGENDVEEMRALVRFFNTAGNGDTNRMVGWVTPLIDRRREEHIDQHLFGDEIAQRRIPFS